MDYYELKHNILRELSLNSNDIILDKNSHMQSGLSIKEISSRLNILEEEINLALSELQYKKEILSGTDGIFIQKSGVTAYTNKLYLKELNSYRLQTAKSWVDIFVAPLSLVVAIIALVVSCNNESQQEKVELIQNQIESQQKNIDYLKKQHNLNTENKP